MHYFKFNIATWSLSTSHLTFEEDAVYFRLISHYYDTEQPIPLETQSVIRRLRLGSQADTVNKILAEFFIKTENGFVNHYCDNIIKKYQVDAKKNKKNGKSGGRPKKNKDLQQTQNKPTGLPLGTESQPTGNPNYKPITNNQEPLTIEEISASDDAPVRSKRFIPPNLSEVITAMNARVTEPFAEANRFLNYYEANGWRVGRNPMKSWTHAVNNWVSNSEPRAPPAAPIATQPQTIYDRLNDRSWAD